MGAASCRDGSAMNPLGRLTDPSGQRVVDATPTYELYRDTTCDEFDGVVDRVDQLVEASVRGSLTTVFLDGPRILFRFCHEGDRRATIVGEGSWWTSQDAVVKAVAACRQAAHDEQATMFRATMRERLAVKVDWGKMTYLRTLRIPPGVSVRVLVALAAAQAEFDSKRYAGRVLTALERQQEAGRKYEGGAVQYIIVLSHLKAIGLVPSEPVPLVKFLADYA
jgi:hypothetical protein